MNCKRTNLPFLIYCKKSNLYIFYFFAFDLYNSFRLFFYRLLLVIILASLIPQQYENLQSRITSSPCPVAVQAPTSLSTNNPAPIIGESPKRPRILKPRPLVVQLPLKFPLCIHRYHSNRIMIKFT